MVSWLMLWGGNEGLGCLEIFWGLRVGVVAARRCGTCRSSIHSATTHSNAPGRSQATAHPSSNVKPGFVLRPCLKTKDHGPVLESPKMASLRGVRSIKHAWAPKS